MPEGSINSSNQEKLSYDELIQKIARLEKQLEETKCYENIVRQIIEKTGEKSGIEFLKSLAVQISTIIGFKYVLIGKLIKPDNTKLETLALCCNGNILENITYLLADTPCESVAKKNVCFYPDNIQQEFPKDIDLVHMGAVSYLGVPLIGSSGDPTGILVALHDEPMNNFPLFQSVMMSFTFRSIAEIERIEAMEMLEETHNKYKRLVEGSPDMIYIFSNVRGGIYYSRRIEEILGYSPEYLLQHQFIWHDSIHPDDLPKVDNAIYQSEKGIGYKIEYRIKDRFGKLHWFQDRFIGKVAEENEIIIEGLATDITERKNAEIALKESQKLLKDFLDNTTAISYIKNKNLEIVFISKEAERVLNLKVEDIIGKKNEDYLPPEIAEQVTKNDLLIFKDKMPIEFEEIVHVNTAPRTYIAKKFPIFDINGNVYLLGGVSIDITSRKNMEAELLMAKEKAERAIHIKDKFISLVAHDLRNPVSSIGQLLETVLYKEDKVLSEHSKKLISLSLNGIKEMSQLIHNILNINRIKGINISLQLFKIKPYELIIKIIDNFSYIASQKEIKIINNINENSEILTDPSLVKQVIENILSNALKFSKRGDIITISMLETKPHTFVISDTGTGIPQNMINDIFDINKKISIPGTLGETGTGLGLPLSFEIIKNLGGTLTVESEPGKGSTFYIWLPPR